MLLDWELPWRQISGMPKLWFIKTAWGSVELKYLRLSDRRTQHHLTRQGHVVGPRRTETFFFIDFSSVCVPPWAESEQNQPRLKEEAQVQELWPRWTGVITSSRAWLCRNKASASELRESRSGAKWWAGGWVSDYSKWPARSSIPRLGLTVVNNRSSRRCSETKTELERGNGRNGSQGEARGTEAQKSSNGSPDEGRKGWVNKKCIDTRQKVWTQRPDRDNKNPPWDGKQSWQTLMTLISSMATMISIANIS